MTAMASILCSGPAGCEPITSSLLSMDPVQLNGTAPPTPNSGDCAHPNVFVRGLPLAWGESELASVFSQYGELSSIRLVRHSMTKHSLGYGFVRYNAVQDAQMAIAALDGTTVLGHKLQVKFADADAGPPAAATPSGLTPSDSCYAKHLPANWGSREVQQLFEQHGAVLDVKLFPCLDHFRGASALIRMASVEAAERAIAALNNTTPASGVQSLIVRFAESAAEKAARLQRRERQQQQQAASAGRIQAGIQRDNTSSGSLSQSGQVLLGSQGGALLTPEQQLQQALSAISLGDASLALPPLGGMPMPQMGMGPGTSGLMRPQGALTMAPTIPVNYQPAVLSSITLRGLPQQADRLWIYEHFARFGPIAGISLSVDETNMCSGNGFVNFGDQLAADRARQLLNGMRVGDRVLQVMVQPVGTAPSAVTFPDGSVGSASLPMALQQPDWPSMVNLPAMQQQQPAQQQQQPLN